MSGWWITDYLNNPDINGAVWVVSSIVWVVFSICLHELAHGWTAIRLGDDTPVVTGHMTWNPMVHMGGYSLVIFVLIGIAWGAMPINPSRLRGRYAESVVALAGPVMNLLLAALALVLLILWVPLAQGQLIASVSVPEPLATNMRTFLFLGAMLNTVLMLFNLLPVPPLDGGRIALDIFPPYRRVLVNDTGRWVVLGVFLLFFIFVSPFMFPVAHLSVEGISHAIWGMLFPGVTP